MPQGPPTPVPLTPSAADYQVNGDAVLPRRQPPYAGDQRVGHQMVLGRGVAMPHYVSQFVHRHRQQVHLPVGFGAEGGQQLSVAVPTKGPQAGMAQAVGGDVAALGT